MNHEVAGWLFGWEVNGFSQEENKLFWGFTGGDFLIGGLGLSLELIALTSPTALLTSSAVGVGGVLVTLLSIGVVNVED